MALAKNEYWAIWDTKLKKDEGFISKSRSFVLDDLKECCYNTGRYKVKKVRVELVK